jgi:hypothetical protein
MEEIIRSAYAKVPNKSTVRFGAFRSEVLDNLPNAAAVLDSMRDVEESDFLNRVYDYYRITQHVGRAMFQILK